MVTVIERVSRVLFHLGIGHAIRASSSRASL